MRPEEHPSGAKAHADCAALAARLKSCPAAEPPGICPGRSLSAACLAPEVGFSRVCRNVSNSFSAPSAASKARHRGSTTQSITHPGCCCRSAVTAGRACRMSPMAPNRTTSKRNLDCVCKLQFSHKEGGDGDGSAGASTGRGNRLGQPVKAAGQGALRQTDSHPRSQCATLRFSRAQLPQS